MDKYLQLIKDIQLLVMQDLEHISVKNEKTDTLETMYKRLDDIRNDLYKLN